MAGWIDWPLAFLLFLQFSVAVFGGKSVEVKETVLDSPVVDIQWLGPTDKILLLRTRKGRLYRSEDSGAVFLDIVDTVASAEVVPQGRQAAPLVIEKVIASAADKLVVSLSDHNDRHFISEDGGLTWRQISHDSSTARVHTFIFHKTKPKWALASTWSASCSTGSLPAGSDAEPCKHILYITKDLGRTFNIVVSYVVQFAWGNQPGQEDRIFFSHHRRKSGDQQKLTLWSRNLDFSYTDDFGSSLVKAVPQGNRFIIAKTGFIFVATLKSEASQTVTLMVSNDGGTTFRMAQLPQDLDEKSYTILDTSSGVVMLHVNHGGKNNDVGNVYVSDAEGVRYSLSLPNNVRGGTTGECEFDKVMSMEGTYIANFRDVLRTGDDASDDAADNAGADSESDADQETSTGSEVDRRKVKGRGKEESVIRTVISFDKGGAWSYLKPPTVDSMGAKIECPVDRCWLHLHGLTNFNSYAPFYSVENAVGLIIATGSVGPYLRNEPDQVNTYISRDGGLTWVECHKGAYIYEFGDHGGLTVMANDVKMTTQVVFSWNEGINWFDFDFSEAPLSVDNIMTEPAATSTNFVLYGTRGDSGAIYHLNFEVLGHEQCKGVFAADSVTSDYESWSPSDGKSTTGEKCILGRQVTYIRRKPTSDCFNGEKFERPTVKKNCVCTEEDFECEVGFARKIGSQTCRPVDTNTTAAIMGCTSSGVYLATAYRKVVGDACEGGFVPPQVQVPCPSNSKMGGGAYSVLGSIAFFGGLLGVFTFASKTDALKKLGNYGFESHSNVRYNTIGSTLPDMALDSVGSRLAEDFVDGDDDEFDNDAPQLMSYVGKDKERDRDRDAGHSNAVRRAVDTASGQVPRLAAPPTSRSGGGGVGTRLMEEDNDLL